MVSIGGDGAFPPGSTVQFNTVEKVQVEGEVVCFDPALKILAIRDSSSPGNKHVLRIFNMQFVGEIKQLSDASKKTSSGGEERDEGSVSSSYKPCTNQKLIESRSAAFEDKWLEEMMEDEVPLEGQRAFVALRKTIPDVHWDKKDIIVLRSVRVASPYDESSATIIPSMDPSLDAATHESRAQTALVQVQKILTSKQPLALDIPYAYGEATRSFTATAAPVVRNTGYIPTADGDGGGN